MPSPAVGRLITGGFVCAEARAFLARTTGLDSKHRNVYIALINGLVRDGVWGKLDFLQIYATLDQTTANLNLISSSFTASTSGSPTWAADSGYTTAANKWVDCNWNPSTDAVQFSQNAAHICAWNGLTTQINQRLMGLKAAANGSLYIVSRNASDQSIVLVNDTSAVGTPTNTDGSGFFFGVRTNSTTKQIWRNGVQLGADITRSSVAPTSATLQSAGDNTTSSNSSVVLIRAMGAGGLLTSTQIVAYTARMSAYMAALAATP